MAERVEFLEALDTRPEKLPIELRSCPKVEHTREVAIGAEIGPKLDQTWPFVPPFGRSRPDLVDPPSLALDHISVE